MSGPQTEAMIATYPATCSGCGAPVVDSLRSDPIPVYACGWWGRRHEHLRGRQGMTTEATPPPAPVDRNVAAPTRDDLVSLADLLVSWDSTYATYRPRPVVTSCHVEGCDHAAIDGRCLDHDP